MSETTEQEQRTTTLATALAAVQANLPKIEKTKTATVKMNNGGQYSYKYADLGDAVDKVYPLLAAHGLSFSAAPTLNANDAFVLAYSLLHSSGEHRSGEYPLPSPINAKPQDIGSAITYARRYAFCSVTGVVTEEDDDGNLAQQAHSGGSGSKTKGAARSRGSSSSNNADPQQEQPSGRTENLTKAMTGSLEGAQRANFTKWLQAALKCTVNAVPKDKVEYVEKVIAQYAAGDIDLSDGRPFTEGEAKS